MRERKIRRVENSGSGLEPGGMHIIKFGNSICDDPKSLFKIQKRFGPPSTLLMWYHLGFYLQKGMEWKVGVKKR